MTNTDVSIRPALPADAERVWQTLEPTIRGGEALALASDLSRELALGYWLRPGSEVFVAEQAGTVVGTYSLRASRLGGGDHVATAEYIVSPSATGRGIAQLMCDHSLTRARSLGFRALQLDFVLISDERRLKLWQRAGFEIVGRLPDAFRHPSLGLVDALVMHRDL